MKLAQYDEARNPVTVQELLDRIEHQSLSTGAARGYLTEQWSRSAEHR